MSLLNGLSYLCLTSGCSQLVIVIVILRCPMDISRLRQMSGLNLTLILVVYL